MRLAEERARWEEECDNESEREAERDDRRRDAKRMAERTKDERHRVKSISSRVSSPLLSFLLPSPPLLPPLSHRFEYLFLSPPGLRQQRKRASTMRLERIKESQDQARNARESMKARSSSHFL